MPRHNQRPGCRFVFGGEFLESRLLLSAEPTPMEQEQLEHVNRLRMDPQGELAVFFSDIQNGVAIDFETQRALSHFNVDIEVLLSQWESLTPVAPLIWNGSLANAAAAHNAMMAREDQQQHQFDGELDLQGRVEAENYNFAKVIENIYAFAENMFHGHAGFALDWGDGPGGIQDPAGHRINMMDAEVVEVGIDVLVELADTTEVGPFLITQDFGDPIGWDGPYIVGVVFEDGITNGRYDTGEGFGGVEVEIIDKDGNSTIVTTMSAGGYQVRVDPGVYDVRVSGILFPLDLVVPNVVVSTENVKVDFERSSGLVPPNANDDDYVINEDNVSLLDILENDQMIQAAIDPTSVIIVQQPAHGGAFVNTVTGKVSYSPDNNYWGTDAFSYRIRDVNGALSEETTVSIAINSVNDIPVGSNLVASVAEGGLVVVQLDGQVTDVDSAIDWSTLQVFDQPANGSVTTHVAERTVSYSPHSGFSGSDTFTYRVADINGDFSDLNSIVINVATANDLPTAEDDLFGMIEGTTQSLLVLNNDEDLDGTLFYDDIQFLTLPTSGDAAVIGGQLIYTPDSGFVGEDTFTYHVRDFVGGFSNPATVTIFIANAEKPWTNPVNRLDVDGNDEVTPFDALLVINLIAVDLNEVSSVPGFEDAPPPFVDVDGLNGVTPFDALLIINELDARNNPPNPSSALSATVSSVAERKQSLRSRLNETVPVRPSTLLTEERIMHETTWESLSHRCLILPLLRDNSIIDSAMSNLDLAVVEPDRFVLRMRGGDFGGGSGPRHGASVMSEPLLDHLVDEITANLDTY